MKTLRMALLLGLFSIGVSAQTVPVSGKVFLITRGGDLKPARMAGVVLFRDGVGKGAVASHWRDEYKKTTDAVDARHESAQLMCWSYLEEWTKALVRTLGWAAANNLNSQVVQTKADEEGEFSVDAPADNYVVIASGSAGMNEAWWQETIPAAKIGKIKLSSPTNACLAH